MRVAVLTGGLWLQGYIAGPTAANPTSEAGHRAGKPHERESESAANGTAADEEVYMNFGKAKDVLKR